MFNRNDVALRGTITGIVRTYETETQRVRDAYAALELASKNLTQAAGKVTEYSSIDTLPGNRGYYESACKEVLVYLKKAVWRRLVAQLGIRKLLSEKRAKELDEKLDKDSLPEITVENVYEMFTLLLENANHFAVESIVEVYNKLHRPNSSYKTNQRNAFEDLGQKVILGGIVDNQSHYGQGEYHPFKVSYYNDNFLRDVDRVFHNLDGAEFIQQGYQSPLIDAINTSCDGTGQTKYFRFRCYGNRNLHLEFIRPDLLRKFNRIANDGTRLKSGIKF